MSEFTPRTEEEIKKLLATADKLVDRAEAEGNEGEADSDADLIRSICRWLLGEQSFKALLADQDMPS